MDWPFIFLFPYSISFYIISSYFDIIEINIFKFI